MSNIKYSIIIPVYNAEKFLKECLFSVLSSDRSDIEIIAIDDGSTDNSLQILKSIQSLDHRLMIFHRKMLVFRLQEIKGYLRQLVNGFFFWTLTIISQRNHSIISIGLLQVI